MPGEANFKEVRAPDREQPGPSVAGKKASARRSPVTKVYHLPFQTEDLFQPRSNPRPARSNAQAKTDVATDGASNKSAKDSATKTKNPPTPKKAAVELPKTDWEQPGPSSSGIHVPKSPRVYELRSKKVFFGLRYRAPHQSLAELGHRSSRCNRRVNGRGQAGAEQAHQILYASHPRTYRFGKSEECAHDPPG